MSNRRVSFTRIGTFEEVAQILRDKLEENTVLRRYTPIFWDEYSRKYQLGSGNNLWLHRDGVDRYSVSWRYFTTCDDEREFMKVLLEKMGATDIS